MTYIYYANKHADAGNLLHQKLCSAFDKSRMKRCKTISEFSKMLHEPLHAVNAAILLIDNRKELEVILSLKDILWELKLIIIFSRHADITQMEVMVLRPRFLTWMDADLSQVVDVLKNMMKHEHCGKIATVTS